MTDVCLVHMPYGAIERPSIALGILKALLVEGGIGSEVLYPNIRFAEEVGLDVYMAVVKTAGRALIGDRTSAGAQFERNHHTLCHPHMRPRSMLDFNQGGFP